MARSFADEMTINEESGLPNLPENFAWRVERHNDRLFVQLVAGRKKDREFWDVILFKAPKTEWNDHFSNGDHCFQRVDNHSKDGVLGGAIKVYTKLHNEAVEVKDMDALVGLYPPKSIL